MIATEVRPTCKLKFQDVQTENIFAQQVRPTIIRRDDGAEANARASYYYNKQF